MVDTKKKRTSDRSTHQSLARGLRILEVVAASTGGTSLADVARRTNLARSTAHYLMQALVAQGYLRQHTDARNYELGLRVFKLAGQPLNSEQIAMAAMPVLQELSRLTNESVALGVFRDDAVILVAVRDTEGPVRVVQSVGARRPAHCTALGKVLLAWLPPAERSRALSMLRLEKHTPKSITLRSEFEGELRRVRNAGYAIDDEEFIVGVRCLAAPVFNETGETIMALGAIGPRQRMTRQRLREVRPLVIECARRLGKSAISAAS
jgi:DNA-binding IclR family transcriptional regulator